MSTITINFSDDREGQYALANALINLTDCLPVGGIVNIDVMPGQLVGDLPSVAKPIEEALAKVAAAGSASQLADDDDCACDNCADKPLVGVEEPTLFDEAVARRIEEITAKRATADPKKRPIRDGRRSARINPSAKLGSWLTDFERMAVPCPTCNAPYDLPCRTASGGIAPYGHRARIRNAIERANSLSSAIERANSLSNKKVSK
jgi:hypothetical protein